ncbi:MAG: hypothetical protein ACTSPP_05080 [Candidatus Heimdallarchaeaceae archaeon]
MQNINFIYEDMDMGPDMGMEEDTVMDEDLDLEEDLVQVLEDVDG